MTPLLDWLLAARPGLKRAAAKGLLRSGRVTVNGAVATRHDHPVRPGDVVQVGPAVADRSLAAAGLRVVFEDAAVVVVDKPAGLLTVATDAEKTDTAFVRVRDHLDARRAGRPFVVHRLDRDTSGLLLFAKSPEHRDALQAGWERVEKTYLAVTDGTPKPPAGVIENWLTEGKDLKVRPCPPDVPGAMRAATRYRVVGGRGRYAAVEVDLLTGRKHQIRVHLAGLGCPVVGDKLYGEAPGPAGRLGLHAARLAFPHPATGVRVELAAPLPTVLSTVAGLGRPGG
jgi:23S rRNA pseudouridine1911/1915/1917 synthase